MKHLRKFAENKSVCGRKGTLTTDWKQAKGKCCQKTEAWKMAKQLSEAHSSTEIKQESDPHKNLRQAIIDGVDIKLKVTSEQYAIFKDVARKCDSDISNPSFYFQPTTNNALFYEDKRREFSIEDDCFVDEIKHSSSEEIKVEIKEPISSCGRTLDEFMALIDDIGNEWNKDYFTKQEAEKESKAMIYCKCKYGHMCLLNKKP